MNPILYSATAASFTTNGIGVLSDAISCQVTEERNGIFELEMVYPVDGILCEEIEHSRILKVKASPGGTDQLFRIYQITKPISGRFTVYAEHISYQLSYIPVSPFTASTCAEAMVRIKTYAKTTCPFTFWTDKSVTANYKQETVSNIRAQLGGTQGSILDVYGGEYEFDNYTVKLHNHRGSNRGVTLRYGKNITDIQQEENIATTYTGIVGYYSNETDYVETDVIDHANASAYPYKRVKIVDFSSEYDTTPTKSQLTAKATAYMNSNNFGVPKVSISVSFVSLWETEEYKEIAPLERVWLCDTVSVYFEKLGITAEAKVVKTIYNALLDRYDKIEIGEARANLSNRLADQEEDIKQSADDTYSELEKAIKRATDMITGAKGGHLRDIYNSDGDREEMVIMNTDNINTATKVWRWNLGGLGYSSHGYNGPYETAITQNGEIVATFITTGSLTANVIKAGILASQDQTSNFSLNMATGKIKMKDGEFTGDIKGSTITGGSITSKDNENNPTKVTQISGGNITTNNLTATGGSITSSDGGSPEKKTVITGGKITTNNLDATGGTIKGTSISGSTITSKDSDNNPTKTTVISGGDITTNSLTANGGTVTGSTIQTASSGRRIKMDTTTSIKGMNGDTLDNLINLEQSVSGTNQMTIDAKNQLNIRTPSVYVTNQSAGEGSATVYETYTDTSYKDEGGGHGGYGYAFVSNVSKYMDAGSPYFCKEVYVKGVRGEEGESYDVLCTLPVFLNVEKTYFKIIHGMLLTGKTADSRVI